MLQLISVALERAKVGRTCIIVSNRPSSIKHCDLIAVLVRGKITEYGTHEALMDLKGFYYSLIQQHGIKASPPSTAETLETEAVQEPA
jgi:ABC-type multidrug transport system fused ATPase/permease subunit